MNGRYHWDKQLPHGVADLFFEEAARKRAAEDVLRSVFLSWGYTEIIPPTFEYYESLATEAGAQLQEEMYRFFDRQGHILALRADLTIPTARIVGTKLFDQPLPLRFCYTASVFRYEEPQAGKRHEFSQAGIELIGAASEQADAEVVALLVEALQALGLRDFRINMGQIGFFKGLFREIAASEEEMALLREVIDVKDHVTLNRLLSKLNLPPEIRELFATLPELQGGPEVLQRAQELCAQPAVCAVLQSLRRTYDLLEAIGIADHISLDLGQLRGMEYYTGLLFQVFAPGIGFPICGGGRYDNLIAHFGPRLPAVGFAISLERALLALQRQARWEVDIAPHLVLPGQPWPECFQIAAEARRRGLRVEMDISGRTGGELAGYARNKKAHRVLCWEGGGQWRLMDEQGEKLLDRQGVLKEIGTWNA